MVVSVCGLVVFLLALAGAAFADGPGGLGLGNVSLWFKSDANIFSDTSCMQASTNGGPVACWKDAGNNGLTVKQATPANQPLWNVGQINALPSLRFDGDFLASAAVSGLNPAFPTTDAQVYVVSKINNFLPSVQSVFSSYPWMDNNRFALDFDNNDSSVAWIMGNPSATGELSFSPFTDTGSYYLWSTAMDTAGQELWQNGASKASDASAAAFTIYPGLTAFEMGRAGTPSQFLNGDIAELFVFNRTLNDTERTHVDLYLMDRYAMDLTDTGLFGVANFKNQVRGISLSSGVASSGNSGGLAVANAGFLQQTDDVFLLGHDAAAFSDTVTDNLTTTVLAKKRWARIWSVKVNDMNGDGGLLALTFDRSDAGRTEDEDFDPNTQYFLLKRAAGSSADFVEVPVEETSISGDRITFRVKVDASAAEYSLGSLDCGLATTVMYVNAAATGTQSGQDWGNAFTRLQDALLMSRTCSAVVQEIWVAKGSYYPDLGIALEDNEQELSFTLVDEVTVYGGFAGTETTLNERNVASNVTVLSGDIDGNDTTNADGVVTDPADIQGANSYSVVNGDQRLTTAVLDGFTVSAGAGGAKGGGMEISAGSPTLENIVFSGNQATSGGGMAIVNGSPALHEILFQNNDATDGGGIAVSGTSSPSLAWVEFRGNLATARGGAGYFEQGGGPELAQVIVAGNVANNGGGLYLAGAGLNLSNVQVSGNKALNNGGGLYLDAASPALVNLTLSGNRATLLGGGMYNAGTSTPDVNNTVVWNNQDQSGTGTASASINNQGGSDPRIGTSLVQGSGGSASWNGAVGTDLDGNRDADPLFLVAVNPASAPTQGGDLRLQTHSPAIDRGNDAVMTLTKDLNGDDRETDGDADGDPVVDMGAFEAPTHYRLTLTKSGNGFGAVTSDPAGIDFGGTATEIWPQGTGITLTATPEAHSLFTAWSGDDCAASGNPCALTLDASKEIDAEFTLETNTIEASVTAGNGTITPADSVDVFYGYSQTFNINAAVGYHVVDVVVDGVSKGALSSYTFPNVTGPHTITVSFAINTFTISASAGAGGSISPSGEVSVNYDASQTFNIMPNTDYDIADVKVDGVSQGARNEYTFDNVHENHTISATFAIKTFDIVTSVTGNGSISPAGTVTVNFGASKNFTFTPDPGYHVSEVLVDGVSVGTPSSYTFTNVTTDRTLAVTFAINTYTITASAGLHGSISPSGNISVDHGGSRTFTITADTGYHVDEVFVDDVSQGAITSYPFNDVQADHGIYATFAIDTLAVTTSVVGEGSISPSGPVMVDYDGSQTFTFTPAIGYHIADVVVDGNTVGTPSSHTFTHVKETHSIEVTFEIDVLTISATSGSNGSLDQEGSISVDYGGDVTFTVNPDTGFQVEDLLVDGASVGAQTSYTCENVTANHSIHATFSVKLHTIAASAGENGAISPTGNVSVAYGSSKKFTITPATGYHVADVLVDGGSVGAKTSYTFTSVTADHTIAASFAINTYTVSSSVGDNGNISPLGDTMVAYNGSQAYVITPAVGYEVADVLVDGASVGPVTSHTVNNVTSNRTIHATFKIRTFTITPSVSAGSGTITPDAPTTVDYGAAQTFTIAPATGYHIEDVMVDGVSQGVKSSHTFQNVTADHAIAVTFAINTFTITAIAESNGAIDPAGDVTIEYDGSQTFNIIPDQGFEVLDVIVDGTSNGPSSSYPFVNVKADHTIIAIFKDSGKRYITATAEANGKITPEGEIEVDKYSSKTYTIEANERYKIADVLVDGESKGPMETYTFPDITDNHTISATFLSASPWILFQSVLNTAAREGKSQQEAPEIKDEIQDGAESAGAER